MSFHTAELFSLLFVSVLLITLAMKLWLNFLQLRYLRNHRTQVPQEFAEHLTLEQHEKSTDYNIAKQRLQTWQICFESLLVLFWTLLGGLSWLASWLQASAVTGMVFQLSLLAAFALIHSVLDIPWSYYQTFTIEEKFGFNRGCPKQFFVDWLKGLLVSALLLLPLLWLTLWLMQTFPQSFWWIVYLVWMGFSMLMLWVYPSWIAPLFNRFSRLEDQALRDKLMELIKRCQFSAKDLLVMDGSKRSTHANAYFTGFGHSRRVVLFDTLVNLLSHNELRAVLAHELGHFRLSHIPKRLIVSALSALIGFALIGFLVDKPWFYQGLGISPLEFTETHAIALLLFMLVAPQFSFWLTPFFSALSRIHEYQADHFAKQYSQAVDLKNALLKLSQNSASNLTPHPWYVRFYYSHPPLAARIKALFH